MIAVQQRRAHLDGAILFNAKHFGQNRIDDDIGLARQFDRDVVPLAGLAAALLQEEHQQRVGAVHRERPFDVRPVAFAFLDMHREIFGAQIFAVTVMEIETDRLHIVVFQ